MSEEVGRVAVEWEWKGEIWDEEDEPGGPEVSDETEG